MSFRNTRPWTTGRTHFTGNCWRLVDDGEINEAENILLDELDTGDLNMFEMALCFYLYLAHLDEDFLEEHRYTREEIGEGMEALAEDFGVSGFEISMGK